MPQGDFIARGREYLRSLIEPLLSGGIETIRVKEGEGLLRFTAQLSRVDADRLEYQCYAMNALLRSLAASWKDELPEGVPPDGIYVKVAAPADGRRMKKRTADGVFIRREHLDLPLGQLLGALGLLDEAETTAEPPSLPADEDGGQNGPRTKKSGGKKRARHHR